MPWVHIADDNSITLISARSEMGQGVYTSMPMLIAEELNIDVTKVAMSQLALLTLFTSTPCWAP
jgi:isoquinoline 1-oxidoreductase beta subunit